MAQRPYQRGQRTWRDLSKRERIIHLNQEAESWARIHESEGNSARAAQVRARIKPVPPERTRKPKDVSKDAPPLERVVLKQVLHALRHDPRVAYVDRQQSGVFVEGNRHIRVGSRGALDIKGMLVGGRAFEIECKRPGGKPTPEQAERIAAIRANGGVAGYCWSVESALALLP